MNDVVSSAIVWPYRILSRVFFTVPIEGEMHLFDCQSQKKLHAEIIHASTVVLVFTTQGSTLTSTATDKHNSLSQAASFWR